MKKPNINYFLAIVFALFTSNLWAASGDANWRSLGAGVNGSVNALASDGSGNVYAGGAFTTAGGVSANYIAKWNGSSWSTLGSGMNGGVYALAMDSSGNVYAGGAFTTAGGVSANYIAKWNGSTWSALGSGMGGGDNNGSTRVLSLALDSSGNVYAGGDFTTVGGVAANYIAKWNGSSWSALGSGVGGVENDYSVTALAVDRNGNLYAGGNFYEIGGVAVRAIAKWNGSAWSALGNGIQYRAHNTAGWVKALAMDNKGNLYVAGGFDKAGIVTVNNIAKWGTSGWSALGDGVGDYGNWNRALALDSNGNLYVGGGFNTASGVAVNNIAKWNGSIWSPLGSGVSDTVSTYVSDTTFALALDNSSGNLYVGGWFATAGGKSSPYLAKWNPNSKSVKNDFDADGKSDVLFLNSTTGGTQYWKSATKSQAIYPGTYDNVNYSYAGSGDFDGDGKTDLFFTKSSNNGTLIWSGAVKTSATYPGTSTAGFTVAAICDTNGDGKDDVVWSNASTGATQIWPAAAKASATYPGVQSTAYTVAACADFDGDGKADLFWRNNTTGGNQIWSAANKASTTYPGTLPDPSWSVMGAGDVDGDGLSDLVWFQAQNPLNPSIGSIAVWLSGLKAQAIYPGSNGNALVPAAIGDYDGDGKADLLWINSSTHGIEIWSGVRKGQAYESYPGTYTTGFVVQK